MASNISKDAALKMINDYRHGLPKDSLKSAWLDKDIIDFIVAHAAKDKISGIRAYLAKNEKGQNTVILAATHDKTAAMHEDMANGYFDMSHPCPPDCNTGDAGQ